MPGLALGNGLRCQVRLRTTRDRGLLVELLDQDGHPVGYLDKVARVEYRIEGKSASKTVITIDSPVLELESGAIIYESAASRNGEPRAKKTNVVRR
jgi:hypothetical protein